jgi:hypothetical protein
VHRQKEGQVVSKVLSNFGTGRSGGQGEPRRLEFNTKTGILAVVDLSPDPRGAFTKQYTQLQPGHLMVVGFHHILHGWAEFAPKFQVRLQPWSPGAPVMPKPPDWISPVEALKLPVLVEGFGALWLLLTAVIPMNAIHDLLDRTAYTAEAQAGGIPLTALAHPREVIIRDRPGDVFYSLVLDVQRWVSIEDARLGPRVTAIQAIGRAPTLRPALTQQPGAPVQVPPPVRPMPPAAAGAAAVRDGVPPWEDLPQPQPQPLAPVQSVAAPATTQPTPAIIEPQTAPLAAMAATASASDPLEIFRRR